MGKLFRAVHTAGSKVVGRQRRPAVVVVAGAEVVAEPPAVVLVVLGHRMALLRQVKIELPLRPFSTPVTA